MSERLIRLPEVMEMTGVKKSFIWQSIADGKFPKQIKLAPRIAVWKLSDVKAWIAEKVA